MVSLYGGNIDVKGRICMEKSATTYMGLELKNPIIIGSSPLTSTLDGLKKCEDAGAGAVVVKSIFEEQIDSQSAQMIKQSSGYTAHADGKDFIEESSRNFYIDNYLTLIEKATDALDIPVIASVNCRSLGSWVDYVDRFSAIGADALEINQYILPSNMKTSSEEIESEYIEVVSSLRNKTTLPISLKIGPHFSSLAYMIKKFDDMNINGFVLFNRFYQPDIDIKKMQLKPKVNFSNPNDYGQALQWSALLSAYLNGDICASNGIHDGQALIKLLLSGAKAVQIVTAVLKQGLPVIGEMLNVLDNWMNENDYSSFVDFRGLLAHKRLDQPAVWERSQYMKSLNVEF